jgi:multidrug transporter EmrE-like cation transporter
MIFPWIFLFLICCIHSTCCYLSYEKWAQDKWWYLPVGMLTGCISNILWFLSAKIIGNHKEIYLYSLLWDFVVIGVYFVLPIILFDIKLNKFGIFGLILMLVGILLVKFEFDIK